MPTVLRAGPYRFFFVSLDRAEPPHIHVRRADMVAKFWLEPVTLQRAGGFSRHAIANSPTDPRLARVRSARAACGPVGRVLTVRRAGRADAGVLVCPAMMASLDQKTLYRLVIWLAIGLCIYFSIAGTIAIWRSASGGRRLEEGVRPASCAVDDRHDLDGLLLHPVSDDERRNDELPRARHASFAAHRRNPPPVPSPANGATDGAPFPVEAPPPAPPRAKNCSPSIPSSGARGALVSSISHPGCSWPSPPPAGSPAENWPRTSSCLMSRPTSSARRRCISSSRSGWRRKPAVVSPKTAAAARWNSCSPLPLARSKLSAASARPSGASSPPRWPRFCSWIYFL